jgi:hypothetical protein
VQPHKALGAALDCTNNSAGALKCHHWQGMAVLLALVVAIFLPY